MKPSDYQPHTHGDDRRFHVRTYNGGKFQVYGVGLSHICECETSETADMVANALEFVATIEEIALLSHSKRCAEEEKDVR